MTRPETRQTKEAAVSNTGSLAKVSAADEPGLP
jgi:hypothetical protein